MIPVINVTPTKNSSIVVVFEDSKEISLLVMLLKPGKMISTIRSATRSEIKATIIDSPKNWMMSCFLAAPTTLRTATCLAYLAALAVLKFMKLTQAISRMNTAIMERI